ncbi:hypothetical protein CDAR_488731 [Caerostris darwini]|uniref:Uncharacterized protein n=1 Tax=Caerostris darwini TaxID=1538125 RepID=A0AAV4V9G9_9ARAC|nr:hypothetical protein CDAR_488731 [Caerostris darwini]
MFLHKLGCWPRSPPCSPRQMGGSCKTWMRRMKKSSAPEFWIQFSSCFKPASQRYGIAKKQSDPICFVRNLILGKGTSAADFYQRFCGNIFCLDKQRQKTNAFTEPKVTECISN